ncbi:MAG: tail fiber protein [Anoxybacillus gonensis]|nr:tail fiber protein [Anoxybacillus gonensis]
MASTTPRLGLYKKDPIADANDTFNIQTMLNDNWDKIDGKVAILGPNGKILSEQLPQQSLPNASTTQAGIVQLNDTLTSTSTTQAATANAVKQVNDALAAHSADYVKHPGYGVATGSANAYSVTLNPAPTQYVEGMAIAVKINVDNTGPSTINVNGLGAKAIKKPNGNDVAAGNLKAGSIYTLRYNGTNFILQGEGGGGTAQPGDVLSGKTFTNDSGEQTGTMPNRGAYNITPGTSNITIPAGYHNGSGVVYGDPDLIPSNIRQGVSIFGVTGTLIEGKRWASGVTTGVYESSPGKTYITVRGLAFSPNIVVAKSTTTTWYGENILFAVYANKTSFSTQPPNSVNVYADNSTSARVGEFIKYSDGFKIAVWPGSIIGYDMSWIAIE